MVPISLGLIKKGEFRYKVGNLDEIQHLLVRAYRKSPYLKTADFIEWSVS